MLGYAVNAGTIFIAGWVETVEDSYYACYYKSRAPKNDFFVLDKLILHHVKKKMMKSHLLGKRTNYEHEFETNTNVVGSGKKERWIFHKMYSNGKPSGRGKVVYCLDVIDQDKDD